MSLSFGALSVNDVVAAAVTVAFCEIVSVVYYSVRISLYTSTTLDPCVIAEIALLPLTAAILALRLG